MQTGCTGYAEEIVAAINEFEDADDEHHVTYIFTGGDSMKVKELNLRNFRGFSDRIFKFHDRLTLIVGENGSGKTSLLEGLGVALGGWLCGFGALESQDRRNLVKADRRAIVAKVNNALLEQIPVEVKCKAVLQNRDTIEWSRNLTSLKGRTTTGGLYHVRKISEEYNDKIYSGNDEDIILPFIAYYSTARLWNEPIHRERKAERDKIRIDGYKKAISFSNSIKDAMDYVDRLAYLSFKNENALANFTVIRSAIKESLTSVVAVADVFYDMKLAEFCVETDTGEIKPYSLFSDGYRSVMSLIIDICRRIMMLNPQLGEAAVRETGGVVLIDEIDLHLHPRWQQKVLGDLLRIFPKLQFIMTTHAPSVIQSVMSENLMILDGDEAYYPSGGVYGRDVNSILEDIMGAKVRPDDIQMKISDIYNRIGQGDLVVAEQKLSELEQILGESDGELVGIRVTLDMESLED